MLRCGSEVDIILHSLPTRTPGSRAARRLLEGFVRSPTAGCWQLPVPRSVQAQCTGEAAPLHLPQTADFSVGGCQHLALVRAGSSEAASSS